MNVLYAAFLVRQIIIHNNLFVRFKRILQGVPVCTSDVSLLYKEMLPQAFVLCRDSVEVNKVVKNLKGIDNLCNF